MVLMEASGEHLRPILLPTGCENAPTLFERACMFVPVLGWIAAWLIGSRRLRRIRERIFRQVENRPNIPGETWGSPERQQCAAVVIRAIQGFGWPTANFLPEDQFGLLLYGECELEVQALLMEVDEQLGTRSGDWSPEEVAAVLQMPLGELIDHLLDRKARSAMGTA